VSKEKQIFIGTYLVLQTTYKWRCEMQSFKLVLISAIVLCLAACKQGNTTIEKAIKNSRIEYTSILHVKEFKDRNLAVVFYSKDAGQGLGLLEKKNGGWKWTTGQTAEPVGQDDLTWRYTNLNMKLPMFHGVINNNAIKRVVVETKKIKKEAEIINAANNITIWYAILDEPQNPPVSIYGYDEHDKQIYISE
jgi:hypothetical protein